MIDIRPFDSLGHADHGWLDARHHFSFADYHDAARMGWGRIRVWNDDRIAGKSGFPPHPHRGLRLVESLRAGLPELTEAPPAPFIAPRNGVARNEADHGTFTDAAAPWRAMFLE